MEPLDTNRSVDTGRSRFPWILVIATIGIGMVILAGFVSYRYLAPVELPVQAEDQKLLVTAQDLFDIDDTLIVRTDARQITKMRMPDGTTTLEYQYASDDPSAPLYIRCLVVTDTSRSAAGLRFDTMRTTSIPPLDASRHQTRWKQESEPFPWGDQQAHGIIVDESDNPIGTIFMSRIGAQVFFLQLEGLVVEGYGDLSTLLSDQLTNLEARKTQSVTEP